LKPPVTKTIEVQYYKYQKAFNSTNRPLIWGGGSIYKYTENVYRNLWFSRSRSLHLIIVWTS